MSRWRRDKEREKEVARELQPLANRSREEPDAAPGSQEGAAENRLWLLQKHYEEINTNFRTSWELYIKFYTVFLTFNVAALAALLGAKVALGDRSKWLVIGAFVAQDLLCAATSGFMARFSVRSGKLLDEARMALLAGSGGSFEGLHRRSLPVELGHWAGWANCGAMLTMAALWLGAGSTQWT